MAAANNPTPDTSTDSPAEAVVIPPLDIDTPQSDAAIDDIVAAEADTVLAAHDASIEAAEADAEPLEDESQHTRHPIFWFMITLVAVLAMLIFYVLLQPGLQLPFSVW
jgi:hypothetical protein